MNLRAPSEIDNLVECVLHENGNSISNTHFQVGRNLHIETYYYTKHVFQNAVACARVGKDLAARINSLLGDPDHLTIIGYGVLSGMYLSPAISALLERRGNNGEKRNINYAIIDNSRKKLSLFYEPAALNKSVLIVLPVTCTFNTGLNVISFIRKCYEDRGSIDFTIIDRIISVFLVYDKEIEKFLSKDNSGPFDAGIKFNSDSAKVDAIYKSFRWSRIEKGQVIVNPFDCDNTEIRCDWLYGYGSTFYLAETCAACLGRKYEPIGLIGQTVHSNKLNEEATLFPTRPNNDAPGLIMGIPDFADNSVDLEKNDFAHVAFTKDCHLYGHLEHDKNSFLHYIRRNSFYRLNREAILDFFSREIKLVLVNTIPFGEKNMINDEGGKSEPDRLLIVTPKHSRSSCFLQDILELPELRKREVVIISFDHEVEFAEHFAVQYHAQGPFKAVVFFDYLISGGKIFRQFLNLLQRTSEQQVKLDKAIFIIDRTTQPTKKQILNAIQGDSSFAAFLRLAVPLMSATEVDNPIALKLDLLKKLLPSCHLDALRINIANEIKAGEPKSLDQLELDDRRAPDSLRQHYFRKLIITHDISRWLSHFIKSRADLGKKQNLVLNNADLNELFSYLNRHANRYFDSGENLTDEMKSEQLSDFAIKILARPPFKHYYGVYQVVFDFVREKLLTIVKNISNHFTGAEQRQLKFYLKRSVELNSNLILTKEFIALIREKFGYSHQTWLIRIKYYMLRCYKELIYKNPNSAIHLESVLNDNDIWPQSVIDLNSAKSMLDDHYYQWLRIIKTENGMLISQLKDLFVERMRRERRLVDSLVELATHLENDLDTSANMSEINKLLSEDYVFFLKEMQDLRSNKSAENISRVATQVKKSPPKFNETDIKKLREFIEENYLLHSKSKNPVIRLNNEFLTKSRFSSYRANSMASSMLVAAYLLDVSKGGENVLEDTSLVLESISAIMGNGLEYALFIEYKKRTEVVNGMADNIYTVSSEGTKGHRTEPGLKKDGLVYNMIYGVTDDPDNLNNIQTFIVLHRIGENVKSFKDRFYSTASTKNKRLEYEVKGSWDDFFGSQVTGLRMFREAKTVLLFRLSEIRRNAATGNLEDEGHAVLAICLPERSNDTPDRSEEAELFDFINPENVRLLLLLKNQIVEYLKNIFDNDAFIKLREELARKQFKSTMEHGMDRYLNCMREILAKPSISEQDKFLLNFLRTTINIHVLTSSDDSLAGLKNQTLLLRGARDIKELFNLLLDAPYLASDHIRYKERKVRIAVQPIHYHPIVYNQIIPELMINMRKYAARCFNQTKVFKIKTYGNVIEFMNCYNPDLSPFNFDIKSSGGVDMANRLLRSIGKDPLELTTTRQGDTSFFIVRLKN